MLPRKVHRYAVADQPHFAAPQPVNPSFSRRYGRGVQALGLHHICEDGAAGGVILDLAGGDVFVPLDDVWNTRHVEAR